MIRINQIKLPIEHGENALRDKLSKLLRTQDFTFTISKRSIDSRKKPELYWVYSVLINISNEADKIKTLRLKDASLVSQTVYRAPAPGDCSLAGRPIVVGSGPAGLFCAYQLTLNGYCPIILERGKRVEDRTKDVEAFWRTGILNPDSNVVFGEGGAGTFSDGKLNTSVKDSTGIISLVLSTFHQFGAAEDILYDNKPHIGTDELVRILTNMRAYMISQGCEFRFETQFTGFTRKSSDVYEIRVKNLSSDEDEILTTNCLVLAIGHGARDTFELLYHSDIPMESKSFAVGFRVEHPQQMIDQFAYGCGHSAILPSAPYKVTSNFPNGRGVYSFCMCPGGYVVNSSSEHNMLAVNGMSYAARDSKNANSAIIVALKPDDFVRELCGCNQNHPLRGMYYQMELEKKAYSLCSGKIPQQLYSDFKNNRDSFSYGSFSSVTKGDTQLANLRGIFNPEIEDTFIRGMSHFGRIIPGFDSDDTILSGVESRTSSPVRILRNADFESLPGLYPCGEGAGYAGGITSAAADGIKTATAIIKKFAQYERRNTCKK